MKHVPTAVEQRQKAADLRARAAAWRAEIRSLGGRPRLRAGGSHRTYLARVRPWRDREIAVAGAVELAATLEHAAQVEPVAAVPAGLEASVVAMRGAGLSFSAIAETLSVPIGTVKTWCRRARLAGGDTEGAKVWRSRP